MKHKVPIVLPAFTQAFIQEEEAVDEMWANLVGSKYMFGLDTKKTQSPAAGSGT